MDNGNGSRGEAAWSTYRRQVLAELQGHGARLDRIEGRLSRIEYQTATLRGRVAAWGSVAGGIVGLVIALAARVLGGGS